MQDRSVVITAVLPAAPRLRGICTALGKVHGNLPRVNNGTRVIFRLDLSQTQSELLRNRLLDRLDRNLANVRFHQALQHLLRRLKSQIPAGKRSVGREPDEGAFQFTNVAADVRGDKQGHIGWQDYLVSLGFLLEDSDLRLQIGRLNIGDEPPLEAATQAVLNLRQLFGRTITGNHNLPHAFVQRVKRVKKLLLRALFVHQELDVVHQ